MEKTKGVGRKIGLISGAYQGSVARRAFKRAGHCRNLKGHVLEICYKDRFNMDIRNLIKGKRAYLTRSAIATRDDIVVKQGGRVVKRFQCKDTPSVPGARDTVERIKSGQYARTNVVGTSETASSVNAALKKCGVNTTTRVQDSRISTKTTKLIACQVNGANPLKHFDLVSHHAGKMAKTGAVAGGVVSLAKNGYAVAKGNRDIDEAAVNVAADAGKCASSAAIAGAVDVSVTMAVATVPPLLPFAKPIGIVSGMAAGEAANLVFKSAGNMVGKRMDDYVNRKIQKSGGYYAYLKSQGVFEKRRL